MAGALEQVIVRHPDELAGVYRDYGDLVFRRCLATLQDLEAARDATQDVFVSALDNFDSIRDDALRGLLDLARTISYERKRRPTREVPHAHPTGSSSRSDDDPAEIAERHNVLDAVWSGLSPVERRYVADKFAGFSFEEIARRNRRALGTVSSNLARAREHARRMREPLLPAAIGAGLWRVFTDLAHRARNAAHDASTALVAQPAQGLVLSLTLTGLAVGAASPAGFAALGIERIATGATPMATRPSWTLDGVGSDGSLPIGFASTAAPGRYSPAQSNSSSGYQAAGPMGLPVVGGDASRETPEDSTIAAAAPSPHYAQDHTIVAIGTGHTCGCPVTLITHDGGATWDRPVDGPPTGDEVVLPPDYPNDPQIFVGYKRQPPQVFDFVAARFGEKYQELKLLPAGNLALAAGFDSGDPRVFSSTPEGLWSLDMSSNIVQSLLVDPRDESPPSLASPLGAPAVGVVAVSNSSAFTPGTTSVLPGTTPSTVWECPPGQACHELARLSLPEGARLVTSPGFAADRTLAAFGQHQVLLSTDQGRSFRQLNLPPAMSAAVSLTMGPADTVGPAVWLVQQTSATSFRVELAPAPGAPWREVDQGNSVLTGGSGQIVPVAPGRALFLALNGGFLCTADAGATWSTRCPAV